MNINQLYKLGLVSALTVLGLGCSDASQVSDNKANSEKAVVEVAKAEGNTKIDANIEQSIRTTIREKLGPVPIFKILKSKLPNFYEVLSQGQVIYISEDQKFFVPRTIIKS